MAFYILLPTSPDFYPKFAFRRQDLDEFGIIFYNNYDEFFFDVDLMDCSRSLWTLYEWINESSEKIIHEKIGI